MRPPSQKPSKVTYSFCVSRAIWHRLFLLSSFSQLNKHLHIYAGWFAYVAGAVQCYRGLELVAGGDGLLFSVTGIDFEVRIGHPNKASFSLCILYPRAAGCAQSESQPLEYHLFSRKVLAKCASQVHRWVWVHFHQTANQVVIDTHGDGPACEFCHGQRPEVKDFQS